MTTLDVPVRYLALAGGLAVFLLVVGSVTLGHGLTELHVSGSGNGSVITYQPVTAWYDWAGVLVTGLAPLVALRHPWPAFAAAAAIPGATAALSHGWPFTAFAGLLAVAVTAMWQRPRDSWWMGGLALLLPLSLVWLGSVTAPDGMVVTLELGYPHVWGRMLVVLVYAVATALVLGAGQGFRLAVSRAQDEAAVAAQRRSVTNDTALLGERSRLARDLHDVVAHHVSLIAVRAETAPYTLPDLSSGARLLLADIADDSRKALDELRGVLGILRRADGEYERAPQPGAADIEGLVAKASGAGEVSISGAEHLGALASGTGYVAYRVVQEALTNARRHAPGVPVRVEVSETDGGIRLRVSNRDRDGGPVVPGRGLTGMAERVEAVGGELDTEVRGGDFVVEARLQTAGATA